MAMLGKRRKSEPASRLQELERRFDLRDLDKKLERLDLKDLEKRLERLDLKDLEKKLDLDKDLAKRYRDLVGRKPKKQKKASGVFLVGLLLGAALGVVLAMVLGRKQDGGNVVDQVASQADALKDTAADRYQQMRGQETGKAGAAADPFAGEAAIEREVNDGEDLVDSARDTVDSASEDVQRSVDDVSSPSDASTGDDTERTGSI